jgi:hypothetical protein
MSKHRTHNKQEIELDFDLKNYNLDDLYKLFKLDPNAPLNADTLRAAKRILVYTHPDKSGLPPHYFQFFSKAYMMLAEMEGITNNIKKRERTDKYVDDINNYSNEIHNSIKETHANTNAANKRTTIMKEFNARFEEINRDMLPQNDIRGYDKWLRHENPEENIQNHKELYTKRKQELREQYALSTNKIQPPSFYSSSGSSLLDQSNDYTSGVFDTMHYTDLKKSYTETIIPVSEDDYNQMPSYSNIDEYKRAREFNTKNPNLYKDHENILMSQEEEERKMSNYRAYELARQLEASEEKNRMFASQFYKILN